MSDPFDLSTTGDLPVTVQIPGYRLRRQVGEDSIGLWFDAEQQSLGRKVTLKVLRPQFEEHAGALAEFRQEIERLTKLVHPNLIKVLDTIEAPVLALVTERFIGPTLQDLLAPGKPLGQERALRLARGIASGLAHLDAAGLAHKNVTPGFLQVLEDGGCRLALFRMAIPLAEQAALKGRLAQDPQYVAPEQLAGDDPIGPKTPVYQVGALLFHMLAGRPPFEPGTPQEVARAHLRTEFPSLKRAQPFLQPAVQELVEECTARDPEERPDLAELIATLDGMVTRKGGAGGAAASDAPVARRRRRRRR